MTSDDVLEFLVAGATAVQIGTAHFVKPRVVLEMIEELERAVAEERLGSISEIVGTLRAERKPITVQGDG
jgi:dihydroorotate dehydrogenase (NAD+) catalytic subunit